MKHSIQKCNKKRNADKTMVRERQIEKLLRCLRGYCRNFFKASLVGTVLLFGTFAHIDNNYGATWEKTVNSDAPISISVTGYDGETISIKNTSAAALNANLYGTIKAAEGRLSSLTLSATGSGFESVTFGGTTAPMTISDLNQITSGNGGEAQTDFTISANSRVGGADDYTEILTGGVLVNRGTVYLAKVTVGGAITNLGDWQSVDDISGASLGNSGHFSVNGDVTAAAGNVTNNALADFAATGIVSAAGSVVNNGLVFNAGSIAADADVENNAGIMTTGGITAQTLTNRAVLNSTGELSVANIANTGTITGITGVTAGSDVVNGNILETTGTINSAAGSVINSDTAVRMNAGNINAGLDIVNNSGEMNVTNTLTAGNDLTNAQDATLAARNVVVTADVLNNGTMSIADSLTAGTVGNNAAMFSHGTVTVTGAITNTAGAVWTASGDITGDSIVNRADAVINSEADIVAAGLDVTNSGDMTATNVTALAGNVNNTASGSMTVVGDVTAANDVANDGFIYATNVTTVNGSITNAANAVLAVTGVVNSNADIENYGKILPESVIADGTVTNYAGANLDASLVRAGNVVNQSARTDTGTGYGFHADSIEALNMVSNNGTMIAAGAVTAVHGLSNGTNALLNIGGSVSIGDDDDNTNDTLANSGTFNAAGLVAADSVTNSGDFYANSMNVGGAVANDAGKMTVDNTFEAGSLTNGGTLTSNGLVKVNGDIANSGHWTAVSVFGEGALSNSGVVNLQNDMTVTGSITNTDGQINGTSANISIQALDLAGGTLNNINTLVTTGGNGVTNAVINMAGNNSTARINGSFGISAVDTAAIDNIGDLWIQGSTNTAGNLTGSGSGSNVTFVGQILNVGDITNFDKIDSLYDGGETQTINGDLTGATKTSSAEFAGDLTVNGAIANFGCMAARNVMNNASGTITGTNAGSIANYSGNLINLGAITEIESVRIGGDVTNGAETSAAAEIVGLVTDSTIGIGGNLNNFATVKNFEDLRVEGFVCNNTGAVIDGTWGGSILTVDGADADGYGLVNDGIVHEYEKIFVARDVVNNNAITATGADSHFKFNGDLNNQGDITEVECFRIAGDVVNGGAENHDAAIVGLVMDSTIGISGNLNNFATVKSFEDLRVEGIVHNNTGGVINGTWGGSIFTIDGADADGVGFYNDGILEEYEKFYAAGDVINSVSGSIAATGADSHYKMGGNLNNQGEITGIENFQISGGVFNGDAGNVNASITGTGKNSIMAVSGGVPMELLPDVFLNIGLYNCGQITEYEKMTVTDIVVNEAEIAATGTGSVYDFGSDFLNFGAANKIAQFNIDGYVINTGTISADPDAQNPAGMLTELHIGGSLFSASISPDVEALISGYSVMTVDGGADNNDGSKIVGTGKGSSYTFLAGTDGYALNNTGEILNVESIMNTGNVRNTGHIASTLDVTAKKAEGLYSSFVVSGDLENGNAQGAALTEWTAEFIGQIENGAPDDDRNDVRNLRRSEYPAYQTDLVKSGTTTDLDAVAFIANYSNMSVTGMVTNRTNGYIQAAGDDSTYTYGAFDNAGVLADIETLTIDGANEPSGFQVATVVNTSNPQGDYNTYGTINDDVTADAGDLVNRSGGLVRGTGVGSALNVSGNLYNMFGSTIRNFETVNVAGSMANEGVLEFSKDVKIAGDFVNTLTYGDSEATGGVLITDLYNGRLGQLTVEGDATIDGGELWIGNSGEQLAVGQDYNIITVKDGHLTVNKKLQIGALNEYDYDTMWEDNAAGDYSSNQSASATPRLFHAEGFSTDSTYYLSLRRDYVYGEAGTTPNQRSFGRYVDAIAYTLNSAADNYEEGDLFNVLSALDNENIKAGNVPDSDYGYSTGNDGEYTYVSGVASPGALDALEQLSGSVYADMGMMAMQNTWMVGQHLSDFLRPSFSIQCNQHNYGMIDRCCGSVCQDGIANRETGFGRNLWGMYYGSVGDVESDGNSGGFDYNTNGFLVGADLFRSDLSRFGFYGAFGGSTLSKDDINQRVETDSYSFGVYGLHKFCLGNLMANAAFGRDDYRAKRHLNFGRLPAGGAYGNSNSNYVDRLHRGDTESTQATVRMEQSWNCVVWNTVLQPFIAGSYTHMQMDGVNETTARGDREDGQYVTELMSEDYELDSIRSELGLRASHCLYKSTRTFNLFGNASWVHEFGDTNATISNSFTNKNYDNQETGYQNGYNTIANNAFNSNQYNVCSYSISGVDLGEDFAWAGVGLSCDNLCSCATVFGGYDLFANDRQTLHNGTIGVQFAW